MKNSYAMKVLGFALPAVAACGVLAASPALADTGTNVCQSTMESSDTENPTLMDFSSASDVDDFNAKFPEVAITDSSNADVTFENNNGITSKNREQLNSDRIIFKNGGKASVTFLSEGAGYSHLFGYFRVKDIAHYFEYERDAEGNIVSEKLRDCDRNGIPDFHEDLFGMRSSVTPRPDTEACRYIDKDVCDASADKSIKACQTFRYFAGNTASKGSPVTISYAPNFPEDKRIDYGTFRDIGNGSDDGGTFPMVPNLLEPPSAGNNYAGVGRIIYNQSDYKGDSANQSSVSEQFFYKSGMDASYNYKKCQEGNKCNNHMWWDMLHTCLDGRYPGGGNAEWCSLREEVPATSSTHKSVRVELKENFEPGEEVVFFVIVASTDDNNHVCLAPNWKTGKCDYTKMRKFIPFFTKSILNASSTSANNANFGGGYNVLMTSGKTIIIDQYKTNDPQTNDTEFAWFNQTMVRAADEFIPDLQFQAHVQTHGNSRSHFAATNNALSSLTTDGQTDTFPRFPHAFAANFSWNPYFWILGFEDQTQNGGGDWDYEDIAFIIETDGGGSIRSDVVTGDASSAAVTSGTSICHGHDCDNFSITNVALRIKDQPHRTRTSSNSFLTTSSQCEDSTIYYDLATDCEIWSDVEGKYVANSSPNWRRIETEDCATDTTDPDYKICKVNMSLEGYTGSRLCWRALFVTMDEGRCMPLLQAMDLRYDMMRPGPYSRSSPTSMANSIFYGSWELITPTLESCQLQDQLIDLNSSTCFPPSTHYQTQALDYTARGHFIFRDLYEFSDSGATLTCQENCTDTNTCAPYTSCWNWNAGQVLATKGIVPGSGSPTRLPSKGSDIGTVENPSRSIYTTNNAGELFRLLPLAHQTANDYATAYEKMLSLAQKSDGNYEDTHNFDLDSQISPSTDGLFLTQWLHGWENRDLSNGTGAGGGSGSGSGGGNGVGTEEQCSQAAFLDERINCCDSCCTNKPPNNSHKILNCDSNCVNTCVASCCHTTEIAAGFHCSISNESCTQASGCGADGTCTQYLGKCTNFPSVRCNNSNECAGSCDLVQSGRSYKYRCSLTGTTYDGPTNNQSKSNCMNNCRSSSCDLSHPDEYACSRKHSKSCAPDSCGEGNGTCVYSSKKTIQSCSISASCLPASATSGVIGSANAEHIRAWPMGAFEFSTPAVVGPPTLNPKLPVLERANYTRNYQGVLYNSTTDRQTVAYVGGSDGMLHAFDAGIFRYDKKLHDNDRAQKGAFKDKNNVVQKGTGEEIFAYIPGKQLKRLSNNYLSQAPSALAESSPTVADIDLSYTKNWTRNVTANTTPGAMTALTMAAGKNSPVVFALDVTDVKYVAAPDTRSEPRVLWELDLENDKVFKYNGSYVTLPTYAHATRSEAFATGTEGDTLELDTTASRHSPTLARLNFVDGALDMSSQDNARWVAIYSSDYGDGDKVGAIHIIDMLSGMPVTTSQSTGKVDTLVDVTNALDMDQRNLVGLYLLRRGEGVSGEIPSVDINEDGIGDVLYVPTTQGRLYKINTAKNQICVLANLHEDLKNYASSVGSFTSLDGSGQVLTYGQQLPESHFQHQNIFSSIAVSLDNSYRVKIYVGTGNNPDDASDPADSVDGIYFWLAGITDSYPRNAEANADGTCKVGYSAITATPLVQGQSVWGGVAISNSGKVAVTSAAGTAADACHLQMGEGSGYLYQFSDPAHLEDAGASLGDGGESATVTSTSVQESDTPIISAPIFVNGQVIAVSAKAKVETLGDGNFNQAVQYDSIINMLNWQRVTNGKLVP